MIDSLRPRPKRSRKQRKLKVRKVSKIKVKDLKTLPLFNKSSSRSVSLNLPYRTTAMALSAVKNS